MSRPSACRLERFRDVHKGKKIYVVASGSSAGFVEPAFFNEEIAIGVNQVFRRFPRLAYYLRKEPVVPSQLRRVLARTGSATHFVSRGAFGSDDWRNALTVVTNFSACTPASPRVVLFSHEPAPRRLTALPAATALPSRGEPKLVVSSSTITSAIHLAAHMGAAFVVLVGHDCGLLDGQVNYRGYHDASSLAIVWGLNRSVYRGGIRGYERWVTGRLGNGIDIEADTLALKRLLRSTYGTRVHSLNPFVNWNLEGHVFAGKQHQMEAAAERVPEPVPV